MTEDFVSYDLAVKLKEKGFKEQCLAYYTKDSNFYYNTSYGSDVENAFKSFNSRPNHICGKRIDAPTISQVLKWLREEKKFHVVPLIYSDWSEDADGIICEEWLFWSYRVINVNDGRIVYDELYKIDNGNFEDYEQAAIAGIEYVLDNLV